MYRLLGMFLFGMTAAQAQISGDIQILVRDVSQATIPEALVRITHSETGIGRNGKTDVFGQVRFGLLALGKYRVEVEAPGFAAQAAAVMVHSGAVSGLAVQLEVRAASQELTVAEVSSEVNRVNAQLRTTTESEQIVALPISTAGVMALAGTAPGVVPVSTRNAFLGNGSFNSNGGRGRANNITLDNATATDVSTTGSAGLGTVPLDGIREVTFVTNSFSAEYGRNASAQAQVLTRSGSNSFHGRLFNFLRNDKFNARDYFDRTGSASVLRNNTWGGVAGGRIVRDKLFWFGTYEQQKGRGAAGTRVAVVPRPDQVANATDPTARRLLEQLKVPVSSTGTVSNPSPNRIDATAVSGRVDANVTARDSVFVRYGFRDATEQRPGYTFLGSSLPTSGATSINRSQNATATHTHTFGAKAVNQALVSFGRDRAVFQELENFGGPEVLFSDGTAAFGIWSGLPQGRVQNTYEILNTLTYTEGRHTLKFGVDANRVQLNSSFDLAVRGQFQFLNLNDFLNGKPFAYNQRFGNSVRGNRVWNHYYFAQDDVRVTRHLTLSIGLRVEANTGVGEVNGLLSNLNLNGADGPLGSFYKGGVYSNGTWNFGPRIGFAYNPGGGKTAIRGGYGITHDFLYLNPVVNGRFMPPFMYQFSLTQAEFTGGNTFASLLAGNAPFQQQGNAAVGGFPANVKNFGAINPIDQGLRNPQVQQFSLSVERELPMRLMVRGAYSGTKGNYLQRSRPINTIAPGAFIAPQTLEEQQRRQAAGEFSRLNTSLNGNLLTPSRRIDPRFNSVLLIDSSANSNYHSGQFSVERRFAGGYMFQVAYTIAKSIDDVSDAMAVLANDTASQQNPFNNRNNRAVSQFDMPQRLVIAHHFEPKLRLQHAVGKHVFNGWIFSGIFQAQRGFPANIVSGSSAGLSDPLLMGGAGAVRPNLIGPLNLAFEPNPGSGARNPNKVLASGLAQPLVGSFGTLGRNVVRLNPLVNSDVTVGKRFRLSERFSTEFQAQMFNLFNNTVFSRPGLSMSAPSSFGYYADTDTDTRNMTMVLRFIW